MLEELAINLPSYQKESFIKSFSLFFIVIEVLLVVIFYNDAKLEKEHSEERLFLKLKNYSYTFDDNNFNIDIIEYDNQKLYELKQDTKNYFIYVQLEENTTLKVIYSKNLFIRELDYSYNELWIKFLFFTLINIVLSILFSFYSLYPLQKSLTILKEFMKDIIHDINTPITAIKINLSLIDKQNEELQFISHSVNTLEMLHKNLDNYLSNSIIHLTQCSIKVLLEEQIVFFQNMYDNLDWKIDIENAYITSDHYLLGRVIYNLLNNACKHNTSNGFVSIIYKDKELQIINSSYGIKYPHKVFERFYKESNRGLGIGLHIVSKLLKQLNIKYKLDIDSKNRVSLMITFR
jgi:signal transduction histidine kinase